MDTNISNCSSSVIDSIRKAGISRRGGVKVRGGRLPKLNLQHVINTKKVVAPKIPQRRVKAKKEPETESFQKQQEFYIKQEHGFKGNGDINRGRYRSRNYIQTEGTLFGIGPALKPKITRQYSSYERSSYSKFSYFGIKSENEASSKEIEGLLESYSDAEVESDSESDLKPMKFPCVKEISQEIKKEPIESTKTIIKVEPTDNDDDDSQSEISLSDMQKKLATIKTEPGLDPIKTESDFKSIKKESQLDSNKYDLKKDLKKVQGNGILMLLQFPSCLPIYTNPESLVNKQSTSDAEENDKNEVTRKTSIYDLPMGNIGKFQVLKSGKMRLIIGSSIIHLESSSTNYTGEVVSVQVNDNNGDIFAIGKIDRKMSLRPHLSI